MATECFSNLEGRDLPAIVGASATMAYLVAAGDGGRTEEAVAAANDAYVFAQSSPDAAQTRFVIADGHIGALLQSGRVEEAGAVAEQLLRQAADLPGGQLMSTALAGMAHLGAGRLETACAMLDPAVNALSGTTVGWGYRYRLPHTIALAMRGLSADARDALTALEKARHPSWRYLDYERALARAWVACAEGAANEAIAVVLSAAETARSNGQFAPEVICLQAATQFGDRSCARRLRELESIVDGPRVRLAARFAEALRDNDAAELAVVSEELEKMGDLAAAVDAAAHAALAYRDRGLNGSALGCSTRAAALAAQCGGASTPALRAAVQPLPLSNREREIAMLLSHGLSTRDIAARLTLSVRTVEGHIYRAMAKTDTSTRDALASLVRGDNPTR
jgi:DNA-binding CsgD family transcriptional regulator